MCTKFMQSTLYISMPFKQRALKAARNLYWARTTLHVIYSEHALNCTSFIQSTLKITTNLNRERLNLHVIYSKHALIFTSLIQGRSKLHVIYT